MNARSAVRLECSGCGRRVPLTAANPWVCPARQPGDDIDHVLVRRLKPDRSLAFAPIEGNPFVTLRGVMSYGARAQALGIDDRALVALIEQLDAAVAQIDGHGFLPTAWEPQPGLVDALDGFSGTLWTKDETENVAQSHKARHLMGTMIHLLVSERAGLLDPRDRPRLALASCGNAALAAGVIAAAARWPLDVYVPNDADRPVQQRLRGLGAQVTVCPRDGQPGDPCVRAFRAALVRGALPFSVQGSDNGTAIEGGLTLGYEVADQIRQSGESLAALVVQVGGGALASGCLHALRDSVTAGVLATMPKVHTVQTTGAWPLRRAWERVVAELGRMVDEPVPDELDARARWARQLPSAVIDQGLRWAARHRSSVMWPWEHAPCSVARGILDDETYDWWALVDGMIRTGGIPVIAQEEDLVHAHRAVTRSTGIEVSMTGSAGVAGLRALSTAGAFDGPEVVGVLLTGQR